MRRMRRMMMIMDKEMMVIGGEGREDRVLKLRLKDRK